MEKHSGRWKDCKKCREAVFDPDHLGRGSYDYAAKAGNPPHLPFKFNFDEDAKKFNWSTLVYPKCCICGRKVDTVLESFTSTMSSCAQLVVCQKCSGKGQTACDCPVIAINNSMDKY